MTNRYQLTAIPHIGEALGRGVEFRVIEPKNIIRPPGYEPDPRLTQARDYHGFTSKTPATHRWCMDLFENSWDAGGRIRSD